MTTTSDSNGDGDARVERALEAGFGALGDWLDLVRAHEIHRRSEMVQQARRRRDHLTRVVMAVLSLAVIAAAVAAVRG